MRKYFIALLVAITMIGFGGVSIAAPGENQGKGGQSRDKGEACPDHTPGGGRTPPAGCGHNGGMLTCEDNEGVVVLEIPLDPVAHACVIVIPADGDEARCGEGEIEFDVPDNPLALACVRVVTGT